MARQLWFGGIGSGSSRPTVAGLFAGIGGIELGLQRAGAEGVLLCEIDAAASAVLRSHFPDAQFVADVRTLEKLPDVDIISAGFPCQDLSVAGKRAGILGANSGLVQHLLRILASIRTSRF